LIVFGSANSPANTQHAEGVGEAETERATRHRRPEADKLICQEECTHEQNGGYQHDARITRWVFGD